MTTCHRPFPRSDALLLGSLWLAGVLADLLWVHLHQLPPAWDQGDHLSRALGFWGVLQHLQPLSGSWWQELWAQAPSYRGPLTYLVSAPLFSLLGPGYGSAILSNSLFQALLLLSLYGQGRLLGSRAAGLWAAFLSAVAPALLNQRSDYLIDFSLTAVVSGCWLLLSWRRLGAVRHPWLASALAGLALGAVLLTRPTGLLLLWLPLLLLLTRAFGMLRRGRWTLLGQAGLAAAMAWLVAGGWISQNWLTILSTVNKARRWGVLYQEDLGPGSLAGWLYYPRQLPAMAGATLVIVVLVAWLLANGRRGRWPTLAVAGPARERLPWWLSFPAGGLLLASLMTTKDIRFVLPLLPQLLLGLGLLIADSGRWLKLTVLGLGLSSLLACQFGLGPNLSGFPARPPRQGPTWPLEAIVATIRRQSPQQLSTLAVLPDSELLNAFNLEAEGRRQHARVAARQTLAPLEHLDEDLAGFDWFLLKGGDQGVMSDARQARLTTLVQRSPAFRSVGVWSLPDGSQAQLFRRRQLSLEVSPAVCPGGGQPLLELWPAPQPGAALVSRLTAPASRLVGASLLLAGRDHGVGQGLLRPLDDGDACLAVLERLAPAAGGETTTPAAQGAELLLADGNRLPLRLQRHTTAEPEASAEPAAALAGAPARGLSPDASRAAAPMVGARPADQAGARPAGGSGPELSPARADSPISAEASSEAQPATAGAAPPLASRHTRLLELGRLLRQGELDELFARVGRINQHDPEQRYLVDGEAILRARLQGDPDQLDLLYPLALAQALQRRADAAALTLSRITRLDPDNASAHLGLGFVQLYRFRPWAAQPALDHAALLDPGDSTLRTLRIVAAVMRCDLIEAHSLLTR